MTFSLKQLLQAQILYLILNIIDSSNADEFNWKARQEFVANDFTDSNVTFEWSIEGSFVLTPYYTDCGVGYKQQRLLGGFQKFGTDVFVRKKLQNIPPHYSSSFSMKLYFIDTWGAESIWVSENGTQVQYQYKASGQTQTDSLTNCGAATVDYIQDVVFLDKAHTSPTHEIIIKSDLLEDSAIASWGIKDFVYTIKACHKSCASCTSAQQGNECSTCYPNSTKIVGGLCECNPKFYPYIPEAGDCTQMPCTICKQCDDSCYMCKGPFSSDCLKCQGSKYLQDGFCVDTCKDGTYKNNAVTNDNQCSKCDVTCKTCSGPDANKCISCSPPNFFYDNTCISSCLPFYYEITLPQRSCVKCAANCRKCTGPTATECTECDTLFYLIKGECKSTCPNKYYKNTSLKLCQPCDPTCLQCDQGTNNDQCSECDTGRFLDTSTAPFSYCANPCPNRYFGDIATKKCKNCSPGCFQCTDQNICNECELPSYKVGNKCSSCQDGFYGDDLTKECKACNPSCKKCAGGSPQSCLECPPGMFLYKTSANQGRCLDACIPPRFGQNSDCVENCDPGYFGDQEDVKRMCKQCNLNCALCFGSKDTQCTKCQNNHYLFINSCLSICPDRYYQKVDICALCDDYCGTCNGPSKSNCLSCAPPLYGTGSNCDPKCPPGTFGDPITRKCNSDCKDGQYKDITNGVCLTCNQKCKTCTGPQSTNCIICKEPYFDNGGQCDDCPSSQYGYVDLSNNGKRICKPCPEYCTQCEDDTKCLKCVIGRKLTPTGCKESCPANTYADPKTQVCVSECPIGYYPDGTSNDCSPCASRCGKCYNKLQENCFQCIHPYYLYNTECVQTCPQDYFADSLTWNCIKCPLNCVSCSGTDICQKCTNGQVLLSTKCVSSCPSDMYDREGVCVTECGRGYYIMQNQATKKCGQCSRFCVECTEKPTKCTQCKFTLNTKLYLQGDVCQLKCDEGYYLPASSKNVCTQCDKKCQNCVDSKDNCQGCKDPYFFFEGQCLHQCPSPLQGYLNECLDCFPGTYYDEDTKSCSKCHVSCKQCEGKRYDQCTKCWNKRGLGLENQPVDGICECQEGYTEMFDRLCSKNDEASSKYSAVAGLSTANTVFQLIFYVLSANPISFIIMANLGQNLNMISYLDLPYGFQLQETVRLLGKFHITQGLGAPAFNQKDRLQMNNQNTEEIHSKTLNESKNRNLYEVYNTWSDRKFEKNSFTGSFLNNMIIFSCIQGFIWLSCYLMNRYVVKNCDHHSFIYHLNQLVTYNLPLALFFLSYYEVIISILLQFKIEDYSSLFNQFSFVFALFGLAYVVSVVFNYIKIMNYQKPFDKPETFVDELLQRRVYWSYIRLDQGLQRNFHLIIIIQKTLISLVLVFMYGKSVVAQASIIFVIYLLTMIYFIALRPLNRKRYLFLQIFNEFFTCIIWILLIEEGKSQEKSIITSNINRSYHIHNIILMLFIAHFLFIIFEFIVNIRLLIQRYKMARSIIIESISRFIEWLNRRNLKKRQNFLLKNFSGNDQMTNADNENQNKQKQDNYISNYELDYIQLLTGHDLKNPKTANQDDIVDLEIDEEEVNLIKQKKKFNANNLNLLLPEANQLNAQQSTLNKGEIIGLGGLGTDGVLNINQGKQGEYKDGQNMLIETSLINLDLLKENQIEKLVLEKELVMPNINLQRKAQNHCRLYLKDELSIDRFKVFGEYTGNKFALSCQGRQPQTDLNNGLYDIYEYDEFMNDVLLKDENEDSFEVIDFMDRNKQYYSDKLNKNDKNNQSNSILSNRNIQSQQMNQFAIFPDKNVVDLQNNQVYPKSQLQRYLDVEEGANQVRQFMDMETQGKFKILKKKDVNTGRIFTIAVPLSVDLQNKRQALANKILTMKPFSNQKDTKSMNASSISQYNIQQKKPSSGTVLNAWQTSQSNIYQNQKKW